MAELHGQKIGGDPKYFLAGMILQVPHVPETEL